MLADDIGGSEVVLNQLRNDHFAGDEVGHGDERDFDHAAGDFVGEAARRGRRRRMGCR